MKSKLLFLTFLIFLISSTNYAQSSASQAGIAVQGIARDANNSALANTNISFTFDLYYLNVSSTEVPIYSQTLNLDTDAFGVFSHTIDPTAVNSPKFSNNQAFLRIKKGTEIISDEKLKHVPYAIAANNGVPTGSIMPFIGTVAPAGWVLCDGTALPSTATELIALVGNNAPNLQGMFLRGTGTNPVNSQAGPALKATQGDDFKSHLHSSGDLNAVSAGAHTHNMNFTWDWSYGNSDNGDDRRYGYQGGDGSINQTSTSAGAHEHSLNGNTGSTGATETRPVNYGVNYIIKL